MFATKQHIHFGTYYSYIHFSKRYLLTQFCKKKKHAHVPPTVSRAVRVYVLQSCVIRTCTCFTQSPRTCCWHILTNKTWTIQFSWCIFPKIFLNYCIDTKTTKNVVIRTCSNYHVFGVFLSMHQIKSNFEILRPKNIQNCLCHEHITSNNTHLIHQHACVVFSFVTTYGWTHDMQTMKDPFS